MFWPLEGALVKPLLPLLKPLLSGVKKYSANSSTLVSLDSRFKLKESIVIFINTLNLRLISPALQTTPDRPGLSQDTQIVSVVSESLGLNSGTEAHNMSQRFIYVQSSKPLRM